MQNLTTRTTIRTEFAGMGKKPDGTWKKITASQTTEPDAKYLLNEYIKDAKNNSDIFTQYDEYTVMKRTVITTCEEWSEIHGMG